MTQYKPASSNSSSSSGGIGFVGALTILFIALKLIPYEDGHIIDWSWTWVLSPIWISAIIACFFIVLFIIGAIIAAVWK